jgi:drug/metabolite transporter (DMT)-like permease
MLLMVLVGACGVAMTAMVKHLSAELHPFVIAFWRNVLGGAILVPWLARYGLGILSTRRLGAHIARALLSGVAMLMAFTAVAMIPLAEYTAIDFLTPVFATLFGILFFGETVRWWRWWALAVGFAGVLVITRPGFAELNYGVLLVVAATGIWGITLPLIHSLGRTDRAYTTAMLAAILIGITCLPAALLHWTWPSAGAWLGLLLIGAMGALAQVALSQSLIMAETGAVAPVEFLKLVFAAVLGYVLFDEIPEVWIWLGGALIVLSGFLLVHGERGDLSASGR